MSVNVLEYDTIETRAPRPGHVIGPLGEPLTLDSLPPPSTTRWVVRRKAEVVSAVNGGLLSVDEACARYSLSLEEFAGWQRAVDRSGMPGLRVTRIQHYRSLYDRQQNYCRRPFIERTKRLGPPSADPTILKIRNRKDAGASFRDRNAFAAARVRQEESDMNIIIWLII